MIRYKLYRIFLKGGSLVLFHLLSVLSLDAQNSPSSDREETEKEILDLLRPIHESWYDGNPMEYTNVFADEFLIIDPSTNWDRVTDIEVLKQKSEAMGDITRADSFKIEGITFQYPVQPVVFSYILAGYSGGKNYNWNVTEVLVKTEDGYRIIHGHYSLFSPELMLLPKNMLFIIGTGGLIFGLVAGFLFGRWRERRISK